MSADGRDTSIQIFDRFLSSLLETNNDVMLDKTYVCFAAVSSILISSKVHEGQDLLTMANFPHFRMVDLVEFERLLLATISYQVTPLSTPSSFVRHMLALCPEHAALHLRIIEMSEVYISEFIEVPDYVVFAPSTIAISVLLVCFAVCEIDCRVWISRIPNSCLPKNNNQYNREDLLDIDLCLLCLRELQAVSQTNNGVNAHAPQPQARAAAQAPISVMTAGDGTTTDGTTVATAICSAKYVETDLLSTATPAATAAAVTIGSGDKIDPTPISTDIAAALLPIEVSPSIAATPDATGSNDADTEFVDNQEDMSARNDSMVILNTTTSISTSTSTASSSAIGKGKGGEKMGNTDLSDSPIGVDAVAIAEQHQKEKHSLAENVKSHRDRGNRGAIPGSGFGEGVNTFPSSSSSASSSPRDFRDLDALGVELEPAYDSSYSTSSSSRSSSRSSSNSSSSSRNRSHISSSIYGQRSSCSTRAGRNAAGEGHRSDPEQEEYERVSKRRRSQPSASTNNAAAAGECQNEKTLSLPLPVSSDCRSPLDCSEAGYNGHSYAAPSPTPRSPFSNTASHILFTDICSAPMPHTAASPSPTSAPSTNARLHASHASSYELHTIQDRKEIDIDLAAMEQDTMDGIVGRRERAKDDDGGKRCGTHGGWDPISSSILPTLPTTLSLSTPSMNSMDMGMEVEEVLTTTNGINRKNESLCGTENVYTSASASAAANNSTGSAAIGGGGRTGGSTDGAGGIIGGKPTEPLSLNHTHIHQVVKPKAYHATF